MAPELMRISSASTLGCYSPYTEGENEVIFPMKKEFVVNVYKDITPKAFKELMESEVKE